MIFDISEKAHLVGEFNNLRARLVVIPSLDINMSIGCLFDYQFENYDGWDSKEQPSESHCKKLFEQIKAYDSVAYSGHCVVYQATGKNDKCFQNLDYKKKYLYK